MESTISLQVARQTSHKFNTCTSMHSLIKAFMINKGYVNINLQINTNTYDGKFAKYIIHEIQALTVEEAKNIFIQAAYKQIRNDHTNL